MSNLATRDILAKLKTLEAQSPEQASYRAILLLDTSGSMKEGSKLVKAKKGVVDFVKGAHLSSYCVTIITFSAQAKLVVRDLAAGRDPEPYLRTINAGDSTNLTSALNLASTVLPSSGERVICIVTDGYPNRPQSAISTAAQLKKQGVRIVCVGTDDADKALLNRLASTPNSAVMVRSRELQQTMAKMSRALPKPR